MDKNRLQNLAKLLDFGAACLEKSKINVVRLRGAKKVFFPMMVAVQGFAEGIFFLCKGNRTQVCFGALRSLCDNLIKAKFLYCNTRKHCHVIYLDGLIEKEKQLKHAIDFLQKNPQYLDQIKYGIKDISTALKKVRSQEKKVQLKIDKYPGNLILDTLGRAQYVDKHNNKKNKTSNSLEWIYLLIFRHLSSSTHINYLDFQNYFKVENGEIVVLLSGNPDDVDDILMLVEYLYKEQLEMFLRIFKSPSLKIFKKDYRGCL
jgi:hypothetical protein